MLLLLIGILTVNFAAISGSECSPPLSISNGKFEYLDTPDWPQTICRVLYSCDPGYQLNGTGIIYCMDSTWVGHIPVCKEINCGELTVPANGSMSYVNNNQMNQLDSIVEFRCDENFTLEGAVSVVCLASGRWSAVEPTCVADVCVLDKCSPNPCQNDGVCVDVGDSYSCSCAEGFTGSHCEIAEVSCGDKELLYNGTCYFILDEKVGFFTEADDACTNAGGRLVEILNYDIRNRVEALGRSNMGADLTYEYFWTGGKYDVGANTVSWNGGAHRQVNVRWQPGYPDASTSYEQLYMTVMLSPTDRENGMWNFLKNYYNLRPICQRNN